MRGFSLARDLVALEAEIVRIGDVRLIIIDPITAYLVPPTATKQQMCVRCWPPSPTLPPDTLWRS